MHRRAPFSVEGCLVTVSLWVPILELLLHFLLSVPSTLPDFLRKFGEAASLLLHLLGMSGRVWGW